MNQKFLSLVILFICLSQAGYSQIIPWRNLFQRQQTQPQQIPTIDVNPGRISYGNVRLSELIESIEYIPLETTDDALIGRIGFAPHSFDVSDNYILVSCIQQEQVFLFSRNGRFITRVGRRGQGPGEYAMLSGVFLDEKRDQIFVVTLQQGILVYNLRGEFMRYIPTEHPRGSIERLYNDHFFVYQNIGSSSPFAYEIRDLDFLLTAENVQSHFGILPNTGFFTMSGRATNVLFNDKIHVRQMAFNDTLFVMGSDFSFTPQFVVTAGGLAPTINAMTNPNSRIQDYVGIGSIYQTTNKLLFVYSFQGRGRRVYFDKNSGRLHHFRSERGIPNDFDGGVDFWPRRQDNLLWYQFFDAYYLIENSGGIAPAGGAVAVQSFNRLMERLDPDDNPVLVIVRLRQN